MNKLGYGSKEVLDKDVKITPGYNADLCLISHP